MATHRNRRWVRGTDEHAGDLIAALCTTRAWSSYELARQTTLIAKDRNDSSFAVSRRTIDRVVNEGVIPFARVKCSIALALGVAPWQLWGPGAMVLPHQQIPVAFAVAA